MADLTLAANTVASVHYTGTLPDNGEVLIPAKVVTR